MAMSSIATNLATNMSSRMKMNRALDYRGTCTIFEEDYLETMVCVSAALPVNFYVRLPNEAFTSITFPSSTTFPSIP